MYFIFICQPLTEEEVSVTVNNRKLWSVHLHCLSQQVQEMIRILATSTCQPLQLVLRRVCWQLSDLSSASAIMVARYTERNHSNPDLGIVPKTSGIHVCFFTSGVY